MDTENEISKELAPIKTQLSKAEGAANSLIIKKEEDLPKATELLGKIKLVGKAIKQKKFSITKPLNEALRNARDFFGPVEEQYDEAERIVKNKMVAYQDIQIEKAKKKEATIVKNLEEKKITPEKAEEKVEKIQPVKNVTTKVAAAQFRTVKEVIISDSSKLPREYLIPDMPRIRKAALMGVEIAGVKVEDKQVVAGITK